MTRSTMSCPRLWYCYESSDVEVILSLKNTTKKKNNEREKT